MSTQPGEAQKEEVLKNNYEKVFGEGKYESSVNKEMNKLYILPAMEEYAAQPKAIPLDAENYFNEHKVVTVMHEQPFLSKEDFMNWCWAQNVSNSQIIEKAKELSKKSGSGVWVKAWEILWENYAAIKRVKEHEDSIREYAKNYPNSLEAVTETYEDLITIFESKLPLQRQVEQSAQPIEEDKK